METKRKSLQIISLVTLQRDINRGVILKLLGFTVAMIVAPIGMYFLTIDAVFQGEFVYLLSFCFHSRSLSIVSEKKKKGKIKTMLQLSLLLRLTMFSFLSIQYRKLHLRWRWGRSHGQRRSDRVHRRGMARRSRRGAEAEGEKDSVMRLVMIVHAVFVLFSK